MQKTSAVRVSGACYSGIVFPHPAQAETLQQALITAYHNNPALRAERARLRAVDEGVPQALSGWRPNVVISSDAGKVRTNTSPSSGGKNRSPYGAQVSLVQPLFRGFRTINGTRRAEAEVNAGRQALLSVEQGVCWFSMLSALWWQPLFPVGSNSRPRGRKSIRAGTRL